jgi:hypothetical protein
MEQQRQRQQRYRQRDANKRKRYLNGGGEDEDDDDDDDAKQRPRLGLKQPPREQSEFDRKRLCSSRDGSDGDKTGAGTSVPERSSGDERYKTPDISEFDWDDGGVEEESHTKASPVPPASENVSHCAARACVSGAARSSDSFGASRCVVVSRDQLAAAGAAQRRIVKRYTVEYGCVKCRRVFYDSITYQAHRMAATCCERASESFLAPLPLLATHCHMALR